jgi:putative transposase
MLAMVWDGHAVGMSEYRRMWVPGGTYFFTVKLADRSRRLLVDHVDHLRACVSGVRRSHPFESVAWAVLPNHLHAIWTLPDGDHDFAVRWMRIKQSFSRAIPTGERVSASRLRTGERGIWQRRYWEHLIRDERDLRNHIDYIHFNPVKHGCVLHVRDWPHSSFHRYVREGILPADWSVGPADVSAPA